MIKHIAALALCVVMALGAGCANYEAASTFDHTGSAIVRDVNYPVYPVMNSNTTNYDISDDSFSIVGVVTSTTESENILGIVSSGGGGLQELIDAAKAEGADDVINIRADIFRKSIGFPVPFSSALASFAGISFYTRAELTLIGTAIKYEE
jgi:hypothetical protein